MNQRFEIGVQIHDPLGLYSILWVIVDVYGAQITTARAAKTAVLLARRRSYEPTGLTSHNRVYTGVRDGGVYWTRAPD